MYPEQTIFPITDIYLVILKALYGQIINYWWLWLFLFLFILFERLWLFNKQAKFKEYEWTLLEIKIPREVKKTPKAMEQVLLNIYYLKNAPGNFLEKFIKGEVPRWWSLEIASLGGEIHFYIRTPKKHQRVTETSFYSQYSDIEIIEVPDYINELPKTTLEAYQEASDIYGAEFILAKEDVYPIRTYEEFKTPTEEEEALDPISTVLENLSKISKKEKVFIQILIRPINDSWTKAAKPILKKLKASSKIEEKIKNAKGETTTITRNLPLSPGEEEVIKAIERNVTKPGFETLIRFIYSGPMSLVSTNKDHLKTGILGSLNQYASQNLNYFKGNSATEVSLPQWHKFPYFLKDKRREAKKQRFLRNFRERKMPEELFIGKIITSHPSNFNFKLKTFVLNTEELATIYHLPSKTILTAPHVKLTPSKKLNPPAGLLTFKKEEA